MKFLLVSGIQLSGISQLLPWGAPGHGIKPGGHWIGHSFGHGFDGSEKNIVRVIVEKIVLLKFWRLKSIRPFWNDW